MSLCKEKRERKRKRNKMSVPGISSQKIFFVGHSKVTDSF
jgi:hypothetical protein